MTDLAELNAYDWDVTYRVKRDLLDMGFVWHTNACDISLTTTGSWQDIDLSQNGSDGDCSGVPLVPVGATGAVVEVVNTGTTEGRSGVVRAKEDTRD